MNSSTLECGYGTSTFDMASALWATA